MGRNITRIHVVDVEATCWAGGEAPESQVDRTRPNEIIEIGIARVVIGTNSGIPLETPVLDLVKQYYVRPKWYPILSDYCKDLTGISQETVDAASSYPDVLNQMRSELGKDALNDNPWCSWGDYDRIMFDHMRDVIWDDPKSSLDHPRHRLMSVWGQQHINLKTLHAIFSGNRKGVGLSGGLHSIGEKFEGTPHSGRDDAFNTAKILMWILENAKSFSWKK